MTNLPKTEHQLNTKQPIDKLPIEDSVKLMISEQKKGISTIASQIKIIENIIDLSVKHLKKSKNSRIIYCGAGTSGRIGVQDGSELYQLLVGLLKSTLYYCRWIRCTSKINRGC